MSFSAAQNYQTSLGGGDEKLGSQTLVILYGVFTIANLVSPMVLNLIGARIALVFGGLTYALFVCANISVQKWSSYASGALLGLGAAMIWTAQGAVITNFSLLHEFQTAAPKGSTLGYFNGFFFSIFQFNQFVGNLLVAVLFQAKLSDKVVFIVASIICAAGVVMMCFLKPAKPPAAQEVDGAPKNTFANLKQLVDPTMILLMPIFIYSGFSQGYMFGILPKIVLSKSIKFYTMAVFGISDTLFSMLWGILSDRIGRKPIMLIGTAVHLAAYVTMIGRNTAEASTSEILFFIWAILLGMGDAVWNSQIYAVLGSIYSQDPGAALANFKLFQSGTMAFSFFFSASLASFDLVRYICISFMVVGMALILVVDYCVKRIDNR